MSMLIIAINVLFCSIFVVHSLNYCEDWIQYGDKKCLKLLNKKGTEEEALTNCIDLDESSTLITIQTQKEQDFLNKLFSNYSTISDNVWIGLQYASRVHKNLWMDGTTISFTNWAVDGVGDGISPCVQMSLSSGSIGKWTAESCGRNALFVCQKRQELSLNSLKDIIKSMANIMETQNQKLMAENKELRNSVQKQFQEIKTTGEKLKAELLDEIKGLKNQIINSLIPLGFLYTQLPDQSLPQQLWPNMKWTEVTQQYAGLFFRVEGGGSEPFGTIQQANQSWISDVVAFSFGYDDWKNPKDDSNFYKMSEENWNGDCIGCIPNDYYAIYGLKFYRTDGENRPRNTAIKIWKRSQ